MEKSSLSALGTFLLSEFETGLLGSRCEGREGRDGDEVPWLAGFNLFFFFNRKPIPCANESGLKECSDSWSWRSGDHGRYSLNEKEKKYLDRLQRKRNAKLNRGWLWQKIKYRSSSEAGTVESSGTFHLQPNREIRDVHGGNELGQVMKGEKWIYEHEVGANSVARRKRGSL